MGLCDKCPAACCKDMNLGWMREVEAENFLRNWIGKIVNHKNTAFAEIEWRIDNGRTPTVFVVKDFHKKGTSKARTWIAFSGWCANLLKDNRCNLHSKLYYPKPCRDFQEGGNSCLRHRKDLKI